MDITKNKKNIRLGSALLGNMKRNFSEATCIFRVSFCVCVSPYAFAFALICPSFLTKLRNTVALRRIAVRLLLSVTRW
jgi:hypothetical protein